MINYETSQLWENGERKVLNKLKFLVVNSSWLSTLNLSVTPNLEMLRVKRYCLGELHMPDNYPKLKSVTLVSSEIQFFDLGKTPNLETLDLEGCSLLEELHMPENYPKLKSLVLSESKLKSFDLGKTPNLEILDLDGCCHFEELHIPYECPTLKSLVLRVSNIKSVDLGKTPNLKVLRLEEASSLERTPNLESQQACDELVDNHMVLEWPYLQSLELRCSSLKSLNLVMTPYLETVNLYRCDSLVEISFGGVPKLKYLELSGSNKLHTLDLRQCVNLETFYGNDCAILEYIYLNSSKLTTLQLGLEPRFSRFYRPDCFSPTLPKLRTLDIAMTPNLENLTLLGCNGLQVKMPLEFPKLKTLELEYSMLKTLKLSTPNVERLIIQYYSDFLLLHMFNECRKLKYIRFGGEFRKLSIISNIPDVPKEFGQLHYVEELILSSTKIEHLPVNICMLQHLKVLNLEYCHLLEKLPEGLGQLECLEELRLYDCKSLRDIPDDICNMKHLKYLCLRQCLAVEKLPEMLGNLESLEDLDIEYTSISHLPLSIVLFKDLRIIGSELLLQSCNFTSEIEILDYETFYYRGTCSSSLLYRAPLTPEDSLTDPDFSI